VLLAYMYRRRTTALAGQYLSGLLLIVGLNLFIGFTVPQIDNYAHIGGLIGGMALGFGFDRPRTSRHVQFATVAAMILLAFGLVLLGDPGFGARACRVLTRGL
jgi:membrane associated rhomboid family serine protease